MKKKKLILSSILTLAVLTLIIGISYTAYNLSKKSSINGITSGNISFSYIEPSNSYTLSDSLPMNDSDGMYQTNYFEFTVTSNASTNINNDEIIFVPYEISILPVSIDSGKTSLGETNVKVYLTKVENGKEIIVTSPTTVSSLKTSDFINNAKEVAYNMDSHHNNNGSITTTYRLRAWINFDNSITDWSTTGKYQYKFKVNVSGESNHIGYSTPISCFTFSKEPNYSSSQMAYSYGDILYTSIKITGFSDSCDATNIVIPKEAVVKEKNLQDITINDESVALHTFFDYYNEGETFQEFIEGMGYQTEAEAIAAHAIYDAVGINYMVNELGRYNYYGHEEDFEYYTEILDEYFGTGNYQLVFSTETTEKVNVNAIATKDFQNRNIKTMIIPENMQILYEDTFEGNNIELLTDTNGKFPKGCFDFSETTNGIRISQYKCNGVKNVEIYSSYDFKEIAASSDTVNNYLNYMLKAYKNIDSSITMEQMISDSNVNVSELETELSSSEMIKTATVGSAVQSYIDENVYSYTGNTVTYNVTDLYDNFMRYYSRNNSTSYNAQIDNLIIHNNVITTIGSSTLKRGIINHLDLSDTIITTIGNQAFYDTNTGYQNVLKSVKFPNTLTTIGSQAFSSNQIEKVDLSNTRLTDLGTSSFSQNQITKISIPSTLTTIKESAFSNNKLTKLDLSSTNITTIESFAFSTNSINTLNLPNGLTTIGHYAFSSNKLEELDISNTQITVLTGFNDNNIISIELPSTLTTISNMSNNKIKELDLSGTSITTITNYALQNNQIESVIFPNTLTTIDQYAFYNNKIKNLDLSNTVVTNLDYNSFFYNNLETVKLPSTVTSISINTFGKTLTSNPNLHSIIYPGSKALKWNYAINYNYNTSSATSTVPTTINGVSITAS